jgi:3-hydroxybutyryl-CoA dehydrogenase
MPDVTEDAAPLSLTSRRVGILGSGIMGAGIAEVAARAGYEVVLRSREHATAVGTVAALDKNLAKQVERGTLTEQERQAIVARVTPTGALDDLSGCDLVIESVVEDLATKKALLADLDRVCPPTTIFATNTSTLAVIDLAMHTSRPDRVCGIHFFNPAPMMSLVELVRPLSASDETMAAARAFTEACGKQAVEVTDRAGFIVNALLFPYLNNAVRLWEHGTASLEDIDAAMKGGCNFPMGPFALLDLVGLDTSVAILDALYAELRDPHVAAVPTLRRMVAAGRLGRKSGRGFYVYAKR